MDASQSEPTRVTVVGRPDDQRRDDAELASLCAAVERTIDTYRPAGYRVREVVVMLEESEPAEAAAEAGHVFIDVYDSGYGHGI
jgi:hypothetical protein